MWFLNGATDLLIRAGIVRQVPEDGSRAFGRKASAQRKIANRLRYNITSAVSEKFIFSDDTQMMLSFIILFMKGSFIMEKIKRQLGIFKNVETIVVMALFIALSIVLGKLVAINILQDFRISLENTPVIIAAVAYGPLAGAIVGGLSDMIGCMLVGYTINPIITAGAIAVGLLAGIFGKLLLRKDANYSKIEGYLRCLLTVSAAHFIGSIIIKTLGLYFYFGSPLLLTFFISLGIYAVTSVAESIILYILYTKKIIKKFQPRKDG